MVYKIGIESDLLRIPIEDENALKSIKHYVGILTEEYGDKRNVDTDNGGYILYGTSGTKAEEVKKFFDYTQNIVEYVTVQDGICSAVYILSSDYGVVIVMSISDAPPEILKEIDNKTEEEK